MMVNFKMIKANVVTTFYTHLYRKNDAQKRYFKAFLMFFY